jgi:hypothetical protein
MTDIASCLTEAIEFAEQDGQMLTPAGEAIVRRWHTNLMQRVTRLLVRCLDRIHCLPRTSDTELARVIELTIPAVKAARSTLKAEGE